MYTRTTRITGSFLVIMLSSGLLAQDEEYINVSDDLSGAIALQEIADRAYRNSGNYWEYAHGHQRDGHEHDEHEPGEHDGVDELLSAGEAVAEIFTNAAANSQGVDPLALDIVQVTHAVVNAWPDCEDTFDAVRAAVVLFPGRANEIVANMAVKRDCNCSNGGLWLDQRVHDRLQVEMRHTILDITIQCSCSQVAMLAGIAGLPENREFNPKLTEARKAELIARMTESVTAITERTAALQNRNDWECGCADINIAAAMQGIEEDELRDGTYHELAQKYADEAGDTGVVVDSFGIVGLNPLEFWGEGDFVTRSNTLRRKPVVYRGDNLILDPFNPATEFLAYGDRDFDDLGSQTLDSENIPTDLFISEYIEGWNEEALASPVEEREPEQRNRVIELYNGSKQTIDLGADQYFLEIYGTGSGIRTVVTPPQLTRKTITLEADVTFEFDQSDIREEASEDLHNILNILNNSDLFSEILIVGHTCDLGSDVYNLALSDRRANAVRHFLQQAGLKVNPVRTEGHGEREPRVPNTSEANRSRNRRVEITYVTRADQEIETVVRETGEGEAKRYEVTYAVPVPVADGRDADHARVESHMVDGEYTEGDMIPRQVIGLNGTIEPGATIVLAYSESDKLLTDLANIVTGQLDFKPNETMVIRRLGGKMALSCRAQAYAYVVNYPAIPRIRLPGPPFRPPPGIRDVASPN